MIELLTYYVIVSVVFIGAPGVFFFIVFMPALQNTKGRMVGYKDHKLYGDSSIYENTKVITPNTPYKLAEIIRDTWPQLYYLKDSKMVKIQHSVPQGGDGSMSLMTELKRDRFVFVGWSGLLLFPTAYLAIGG